MANPITFLFGYRKIKTQMCFAADIFNIARDYGIVYRNQRSDAESISFECSLSAARRLKSICEKRGIPFLSNTEHGLPHLLGRYRHRYGIFLGALFCVALIALSGTVVWDIRIDGENRLTEKQVLSELEACGLKIGCPVNTIDTDVIQNRVII